MLKRPFINCKVTVYTDTDQGKTVRQVGTRVIQFIKDIQEKYNQAIIFYQTGKMAYLSSKIWDEYNTKYMIDKKFDEWKKLGMQRMVEFKTLFNAQPNLTGQLTDVWNILMSAPNKAKEINDEYRITSSVETFGKTLYYDTVQSLSYLQNINLNNIWTIPNIFQNMENNIDKRNNNNNDLNKKKKKLIFRSFGYSGSGATFNDKNGRNKNNNNNIFNNIFNRLRNNENDQILKGYRRNGLSYRGETINPWVPFWNYLNDNLRKQRLQKERNERQNKGGLKRKWMPSAESGIYL